MTLVPQAENDSASLDITTVDSATTLTVKTYDNTTQTGAPAESETDTVGTDLCKAGSDTTNSYAPGDTLVLATPTQSGFVTAFSTDGSVGDLTLQGGNSGSISDSLTFDSDAATGTLSLDDTAGAGNVSFSGGTIIEQFTGIEGTITGTSAVDAVDLPSSATNQIDLSVTGAAPTATVDDEATLATLSAFKHYSASSGVDTVFETDGEASGIVFTGDGTSASKLELSGSDTLSLTGIGEGNYNGSANTSFSGIDGEITGASGNLVDLPTSGTITLAVTSSGETFGDVDSESLSGFTNFDAGSGATSTTFTTDGNEAGIVFTGDGTSASNLTLETGSGALSLSGVGAGTYGGTTFSGIGGRLRGAAGIVVDLPTSGTVTLSVQGGIATMTDGAELQQFASFDTFEAEDASTSFIADATGGYTFEGEAGDSLSFANVASGSTGVTVCLGTGVVYFSSSSPCPGTGSSDSFTGITTITGSPNSDLFVVGAGNWDLNGGSGGSDTVSFAGATNATTINLDTDEVSGAFSSGLTTYTVEISGFGSVIGSATAANTITGNPSLPGSLIGGSANDTFYLLGGMEVVNGGAGTNTIDLADTLSASSLNLSLSGFQYTGGAGEVSVIPGTIQDVYGSPFGGTLTAGSGSGTLYGEAGSGKSDVLDAGDGNTYVLDAAGSGTETLIGGSGSVTMDGGSGATTYLPGSGPVTIVTGSGSGTLSYAGAPTSVEVNLTGSSYTVPTLSLPTVSGTTVTWSTSPFSGVTVGEYSASGGWGSSVSLSSGITNVVGTASADLLIGGSDAVINGGTGADLLIATGTGDTLESEGTATILTGTGSQTVICSTGSDCTVDYSEATEDTSGGSYNGHGVSVTLGSGSSAGTAVKWGQSDSGSVADTLYGVSTVIGSNYDDTLTAGGSGQTLIGGSGQSLLITSSAGDDTLIGEGYQTSFNAEQGTGNTLEGGQGTNYFLAQLYDATSQTVTPADDTIIGGLSNTAYADSSDKIRGVAEGSIYYIVVSDGEPEEQPETGGT